MAVALFDGMTNPNLSATGTTATNKNPFEEWTASKNGSVSMVTMPGASYPAIKMTTNDNRVASDYYVNTFDTPDTLTIRSQLGVPRVIGGQNVFYFGSEIWIVMRFRTDTPAPSTASGAPAPYGDGSPFSMMMEIHGEPFAGSSPSAVFLQAGSSSSKLLIRAVSSRWSAEIDRNATYTLIRHIKANSSVGGAAGWEDVYLSRAGTPAVKLGPRTSFSAISSANNATPNRILIKNYHRAYMTGWDGLHSHWYGQFRVYKSTAVTDVAEIDPYYLLNEGSTTPAPVASFTFSPATPTTNQAVVLNAAGSTGTGLTYSWDVTP